MHKYIVFYLHRGKAKYCTNALFVAASHRMRQWYYWINKFRAGTLMMKWMIYFCISKWMKALLELFHYFYWIHLHLFSLWNKQTHILFSKAALCLRIHGCVSFSFQRITTLFGITKAAPACICMDVCIQSDKFRLKIQYSNARQHVCPYFYGNCLLLHLFYYP